MNDTYFLFDFPPSVPFQVQLTQITDIHKHWHPTVELIFVLKGTATVQVLGETSRLRAGDLLLVNSNHIHELSSQDNCPALIVHLDLHKFDLSLTDADQLYFLCNSSKDEDKGRYDDLRSLIALMVERNTAQPQDAAALYDNKAFAYSMLKELTQKFQVSRTDFTGAQDKYLERMNEIVRYIDEHYREDLSLVQLANAVHLSPPYLSSLFSRYLDTTFSDYYNSVRLSHAVSDLTSTDDPIDTVALNNGYANAQSFGRAFKAKYNALPSVYRKTHRKADHLGTGRDRRTNYISNLPDNSGFDISALSRYLPNRDHICVPTPAKAPIQIQCSWDSICGHLDDRYRKLVGIGSAKEILYSEVQEQLKDVQRQIGFEYIKFHGLLSDDMMVVTRTETGELAFNFRTIDIVFDFLFSIRLKPVLQLSFMPIELALDRQKIIFNNKYNTSQPADLCEWLALINAFFRHIIARYGLRTVEDLPVLLWNNADSSIEMFGMQDDLAFFRMYRETYLTIKAISPRIQVGAPPMTFMHQESIEWARRFFRWELEQGVSPDFFCAQCYSVVWQPAQIKIDLHSWQPDHLVTPAPGGSQLPLMAGIPLSTDPDYLEQFHQFLSRFQEEVGLGHLPLWITEWNLSVSHSNLINDTLFAGCYVIKNILEHSSRFACLGYWAVSDFIEEQPLSDDIFHGGLGLLTVNGIRKPQFLAYQSLRQLCPAVLAQGRGYIVTRSQNCVSILLYNYEHFSDIFANNKSLNVNKTTRYTPFSEQRRQPFSLRVSGLPARLVSESVEFIVNREHGSAFDYWVKMGAPDGGRIPSLDQYRLEHLKASAHPLVRSIDPKISHGVLEYDAVLEPLEFRLIQINFCDK